MSLYFDGALFCDLKSDVPQQVIDTLQYMTRSEDYSFDSPPDHEFFKDKDWRRFLEIQPNYSCAPGLVYSEFRKAHRYEQDNVLVYYYTFSFRRCMHDDVEFNISLWSFLNWLARYSDTEGFIGYYREEFTLHPTLMYFKNGKVYKLEVKGEPVGPIWLYGEKWEKE